MSTVVERLPELLNAELPVVRFETDEKSYLARLRVGNRELFFDSFLRNSEELEPLQLDAILACLLIDLHGLDRVSAATRLSACGLDLVEISTSLLPAGPRSKTSSLH